MSGENPNFTYQRLRDRPEIGLLIVSLRQLRWGSLGLSPWSVSMRWIDCKCLYEIDTNNDLFGIAIDLNI